jgi:hypothetical protein
MNNEENINIQTSGSSIPEDAVFYGGCCGLHGSTNPPKKIATFNIETNILSITPTGEL